MDVSGDFLHRLFCSVPTLFANVLFNFEVLFWIFMKVENVFSTKNFHDVEMSCILGQNFLILVISYFSATSVKQSCL